MNYKTQKMDVLKLHDRSKDEIPSEKIKKGVSALSNVELLSLIVGESNETIEKIRILLSNCDNLLSNVSKLSIDEIKNYSNLTELQSTKLKASLSLMYRLQSEKSTEKTQIRQSRDLYELLNPILKPLVYEECWIVLMNCQHILIDTIKISQGGFSETTVDPKIIFKNVLNKNAISIALCHNHPSGYASPSSSDDKITSKIKKGCENLDIQFLDHIIIGNDYYYSYADEGKL